ncbi:MAG: LacI family DNA-binding transcriptional regulator [Solirubrobacterales bacterium]
MAGKERGVNPERRERVTINQVAEAAGVSITTVSHALNGKGRISEATRKRVARTATKMGYRPSASARSLAGGRSGIIGLSFAVISGQPGAFGGFGFFNDLLHSATATALELGYALVTCADDSEAVERLGYLEPEGCIVVDPTRSQPMVEYARRTLTPLVTVGRVPDGGDEPWVDNDHQEAARLAIEHLRERGARRVALILPPPEHSYTADGLDGFELACSALDMEPVVEYADGDLAETDGFQATRRLLESDEPPDGIYTMLDRLGRGAIMAAESLSVSVPEKLKVVASTDSEVCDRAEPTLSTVDLDPEALGREAIQLLVERIRGGQGTTDAIEVPVRLIVRRSSGGPVAG